MKTIYISLSLTIVMFLSGCKQNQTPMKYPVTKKVAQVDDYFGTKVSDPYRWLENDNSDETKAWVKSEQTFTEDYLSKIPFRNKIHQRLEQILSTTRYYGGFKAGENVIFMKSDGLQNQPVYYVQKGLNLEPVVLIDPNKLSTDGSVSIGIDGISKDKKYMAYHESKGGSDWQTEYIM